MVWVTPKSLLTDVGYEALVTVAAAESPEVAIVIEWVSQEAHCRLGREPF